MDEIVRVPNPVGRVEPAVVDGSDAISLWRLGLSGDDLSRLHS